MPTVAVDARELAGRPTGVGRYLLELLQRWEGASRSSQSNHAFVLYAHQALPPGTPFADRAVVLEGTGGTRWEQMTFARALRRDAPDVLFAPAATAPLAVAVPIALTIHDLSYAAHPEWFSWREGGAASALDPAVGAEGRSCADRVGVLGGRDRRAAGRRSDKSARHVLRRPGRRG